MILAVDCGNSAVKVALVETATVYESARLEGPAATEADLAATFTRLMDVAPTRPVGIVAVSVVDRWTDRVARAAEAAALPLTVVAASSVPIHSALVRLDQTGPDRLIVAWAAWQLHGAPVIVVDLGTATTVDAVDGEGFFLGGAILAGPGLTAEMLAERTARLPRVEPAWPEQVIGSDTISALRSGLVIGHVGAVRELVARMRPALEGARGHDGLPGHAGAPGAAPGARVVVCGGHAHAAWARRALLEPAGPDLPAVADSVDPDLLLRGLGLLAERGSMAHGSAAT